MAIRILIADDHEMVRQGLTVVLGQAHPEWEIVAEAADGAEAIELADRLKPDVAILDLAMPLRNGLEVTEHLVESIPDIKVLLLTIHSAAPVRRRVQRAGAKCLLAKNEAPQKLVESIEAALAGAPFFASESASRPASELAERERIPVQYLLTPRGIEILRELARGLSNKEVAAALKLGVRTVESYRADIMNRLSATSYADMIRLAIQNDLLAPEDDVTGAARTDEGPKGVKRAESGR